ncbi:MAG: hypothetical protein HJHJAOHD_01033 [Flavobacteriales bacterium]|nr:hypothetical protein [Flavobacteriales bacterium]
MLFSLLIRLNVWVALGAMFLCILYFQVFASSQNEYAPLFIFFSVLALYNLQRLYILRKYPSLIEFERWKWYGKNSKALLTVALVASMACALLFFTFTHIVQYFILLMVALSIFYVYVPRLLPKGVRSLPVAKTISVALAWTIASVGLPYYSNAEINHHAIIYGAEMFFFIFSVTQPFDIRDMEVDKSTNTNTLPRLIGVSKTKIICIISLSLSLAFGLMSEQKAYSIGAVFSVIYAAIFILKATQNKSEYYFSFFLESTLMARFLFFYMAKGFF